MHRSHKKRGRTQTEHPKPRKSPGSEVSNRSVPITPAESAPPPSPKHQDSFDLCPPPSRHSSDGYSRKRKHLTDFQSLQKEIGKKAGPPWYQELSPSQMNSADGLQNSLRDDLEQYSTTKTRGLISNMGLSEMPNNKELSASINMSRGNDLAFLWFLNEIHYNKSSLHEERTNYNPNEKLLLSAIAHLDMITTLRELDKILPKPQKNPPKKLMRSHRAKKVIYASPYLEPLIRPLMPNERNINAAKGKNGKSSSGNNHDKLSPPKKFNFPITPYDKYKDESYTPPNEKNRWYAIKKRKQSDIDREALLKTVCSGSETNFDDRKNDIFDQFLALTKCKRSKPAHVVYQIDLDNANTSDEFQTLATQYQNQTIVRTIVRDLLENALNVQKLRACCKTIECMMDYEKYLSVLERNLDQQKHNRQEPKYFDINECKFDYDKIFNNETFDQKQEQSGYLSGEIDKRMGKATEVCMKNLFCLEIPLWTEPSYEPDESCKDEEDENEDECEGESVKSNKSNLRLPVDPNDPEQVHSELDDALKIMKKNPKFVLASIPLASEIPMLVEFAFQRFGRTFTDEERLKFFKKRDKQYEKLRKAKMPIKPPKGDAISNKIVSVTWDQRGWLVRRTNEVLDEYYHRVKAYFLEQTRLFWPILGPYLCTDGLPREVFYAYLPASEKDVFPFRPWRQGDNKKES